MNSNVLCFSSRVLLEESCVSLLFTECAYYIRCDSLKCDFYQMK